MYVKLSNDLISAICANSRMFYKSELDSIRLPDGLGDRFYELLIPEEDRNKMESLPPSLFEMRRGTRLDIDNKCTDLEFSYERPFPEVFNKTKFYDVDITRYEVHIPKEAEPKYREIIEAARDYHAKKQAITDAMKDTEDKLRALLGQYTSLQKLFKEGLKDKPETRELIWKLLPGWARDKYNEVPAERARKKEEEKQHVDVDLSNLTVQVVKKELFGV